MIDKEASHQLTVDKNNQNGGFEEIARILSTLAIEGIFLSKTNLQKILQEQFGLSKNLVEELISIFGKNNNEREKH